MKNYQERLQEEEDIRIALQAVNDQNASLVARQRELNEAIEAGLLVNHHLMRSELNGIVDVFSQIARQKKTLEIRREQLSRDKQLARDTQAQSTEYIRKMEQILRPGGKLDLEIAQAEDQVLIARKKKAAAFENLLNGYIHMATFASPEAAESLAKEFNRDLPAPALSQTT